MLRSYLTVIRDSFRAAMNSRVLYIVLALIVLVLLVIAPLHVRQSLDWRLPLDGSAAIPAPDRLVQRLVDEGKAGERPAVAHVWSLLSEDLQNEVQEEYDREPGEKRRTDGPNDNPVIFKLITEFNELMESGDLYDEAAFQSKRLGEEAKGLLARGDSRNLEEDRRLNRLLLNVALRRDVAEPRETQLDFYYFSWHWSAFTTNTSHSAFASSITSQLPTYFDKFIMSIGIFIAILITASIIPEMLEAGSLNLLLSKPVYRWGLLLAKYVGGCVFILLCAILLFVGLWLWMGVQMGIWERAILLSIPTYVFVFAMYYAVSVLAGIWFRSPILCITFAVLFWAVCSAIGYAYAWLDYRHYNTAAREMVAAGDNVAIVDSLQTTQVWNQRDQEWDNPSTRKISPDEGGFVFASFIDRLDQLPDLPGPTVDHESGQFLFADNGVFEAVSNARINISSTNPQESWKMARRGNLPSGAIQVLHSGQFGQLAIDRSGFVYRWTGNESEIVDKPDDENSKKKSEPAANKLSEQISGLISRRNSRNDYESFGSPQSALIQGPSAVALNPAANDEIVFYSEGDVVVMSHEGDKYQERVQVKVGDHDNDRMTAFVACGGDSIFVMLGNGRFYHLMQDDLSVVGEHNLSDQAAIRNLSASPDGKYAALTLRSGDLWIYDAATQSELSGSGIGSSDILACTFDEQNRLWVGDRFRNVRCYSLENQSEVLSRQHDGGWMTSVFRYAVRPLYRIFPKPGEFYKLVAHLSSAGDARGNPDIDMTKLPHRDNPWSPLRSGIAFTIFVLGIACLVFQRQDF